MVRPWERGRAFSLTAHAPPPDLAELVDRHWDVAWDLPAGASFRQETLPHPSLNLVVEPSGAWVWGVPTERDVRLLRGSGWAVGTKFAPGAFTALTGISAARLTDGRMAAREAFGAPAAGLESAAGGGPEAILAAVTEMLAAVRPPQPDPSAALVAQVIDGMRDLAPDARVAEIAARHHLAPRTLQRLFAQYAGVSPKWVLKRLRIHLAVERLAAEESLAWTELALDLGYYDHAHFIRDFRRIVGRSPAAYAAEVAASRAELAAT